MVNKKAASAVLAPAAKRGAGLRNNWLLGVALCPSHNSAYMTAAFLPPVIL